MQKGANISTIYEGSNTGRIVLYTREVYISVGDLVKFASHLAAVDLLSAEWRIFVTFCPRYKSKEPIIIDTRQLYGLPTL